MKQLERKPDPNEADAVLMDSVMARLRVGGPGIIVSADLQKQTCVVQPVTKEYAPTQDGGRALMQLPLLLDVPISWPQGGGLVMTFPLAKGDECAYFIADRCIDAWWQSGGVQAPSELRMHHLADGYASVGINSQVRLIPNVSATSAQFRTFDGSAYMEITQDGVLNFVAPAGMNITTNLLTVDGNLASYGSVKNNNKETGSAHIHSGVMTGTGNTGPVT